MIPLYKTKSSTQGNQGIALFMVLAAISLFSLLVTEFTYVAQVNQKMAYDGFDQLKAHYLAKSGFKLSLLRLKAYQNVKASLASMFGGNSAASNLVPKQIIEKIWSFPFLYPIPTSIPGLSNTDKDAISKFQNESGLDGKFSAIIESESSKYNLNLILSAFVPKEPQNGKEDKKDKPGASPSPKPSPGASPDPAASPSPGPAASVTFNPEEARKSLAEFLGRLIDQKRESDEEFAQEYRDLKLDELVDSITAWADINYESRFNNTSRDTIPSKRAPFYSLSELHMIQGMDDTLYNLFVPNLTVNPTPGININTMQDYTLKALVPNLTEEEVKAFFKYRDAEDEDHYFKKSDDFFKYLSENVANYKANKQLEDLKADLSKKNVRLVTDETDFKITVKADVNESSRLIEAWVTLAEAGSGDPAKNKKPAGESGANKEGTTSPLPVLGSGGSSEEKKSGIRVTYMRIL